MAPDKMLLFARMEFISSLIKPIIGNWVIAELSRSKRASGAPWVRKFG